MARSDILRLTFVVIVLILFHFTLRPLVAWRASPDFLLIAVLMVAVRIRPGAAAVLGFVIGLMADAQSPGSLGSGAMGLALVGFAASYLKASFFSEKSALNISLFFVGKWSFDVIYITTTRSLTAGDTLLQIGVWSLLAAAITAVAGALCLLIMRPLLHEVRS